MSIAHPPTQEVELKSLGKTIALRPWTMGQRAELRPKIAILLAKLGDLQGGTERIETMQMADAFVTMEDEVSKIVRASIPEKVLSEDEWIEMAWEELPILAQAVWQLNVARSDGGGLLGKLGAGLGAAMANALELASRDQVGAKSNGAQSQTPKKPVTLKRVGSPSSLTDGAPTPSA